MNSIRNGLEMRKTGAAGDRVNRKHPIPMRFSPKFITRSSKALRSTAVCNDIEPPTYRRFGDAASDAGASLVLAVSETSGEGSTAVHTAVTVVCWFGKTEIKYRQKP